VDEKRWRWVEGEDYVLGWEELGYVWNSTTLQRPRCARTNIQLVVSWLSIQINVLPYIPLGLILDCVNCTSNLIIMRSSGLKAARVHFAIVRQQNLDDVAVSPKPVLPIFSYTCLRSDRLLFCLLNARPVFRLG
jgi:hypothetical protein